jgi:arginyl-tRNA synthetase
MSVVTELKTGILGALNNLYANDLEMDKIVVNTTKPELEGDYTLVIFSLAKHLKKIMRPLLSAL